MTQALHQFMLYCQGHPAICGAAILWLFSNFVSSLRPAKETDGKLYYTFYTFCHGVAGNGVKVLMMLFPSLAKYFLPAQENSNEQQPPKA